MQELTELQEQFDGAYQKMQIAKKAAELEQLTKEVQSADFWQVNESQSAQEKSKKLSRLEAELTPWQALRAELGDIADFFELDDESLMADLNVRVRHAREQFDSLKAELRFAGKHDDAAAFISLWAGAGGVDAQDWTHMLLKMYVRYAESEGLSATVLEESQAEEAGLKSALLRIEGPHAYGKLKSEHGVHRLVRLSPFNSAHSRETSFAMCEVVPEVESIEVVELQESDLRVDVYRSGGHGGQSVNTTDSAVRITHIPTGLVVSIQNERSQLQNKQTALAILTSKLVALAEEQHQETLQELKGPNIEAAWGNQIRSYVLHPYSLVKDARTGYQTSDAEGVLAGDLAQFADAYLEMMLGKES